MRTLLYTSTITLLAILLTFQEAQACSCAGERPPCEAYGSASAVFVGVVIGAEQQKEVVQGGIKTVYDVGSMRFAVHEAFRGVTTREVEIHSGTGGGDCGYWFRRGQVYLIYAYVDSEDGKLWTNICTRSRPISEAREDLEFLHGMTNAKPGATLFGALRQFIGDMEHGPFRQVGPMSEVKIIVEGEGTRFEAVTNKQGEYRIMGLPPGDYDARPILPENLGAIAQHDTVDRFGSYSGHKKIALADRSCAEMSFTVQSNGMVRGRVTNQEGQPVKDVQLDLVRVDDFEKDWSAWTDEEGNYEFHMVQPDVYLLGINLGWVPSEDNPYPRMFYPGTSKQPEAAQVVVGDGTRLKGYDLTLPPRFVERTVEGTVYWPDGRTAVGAHIDYELFDYPGKSLGKRADADEKGHFTLKLFDGLTYTLYAEAETVKEHSFHSTPIKLTASEGLPTTKLVLDQPGSGYENQRIFRNSVTPAATPTPSPSPTPAPPATDIFLIDLRTTPGGHTKLGQPVKITNWAGYNNQPSFLPDGKSILYTSIRDKQADIYRYEISRGLTTQVTNTPESEYSPTLMPGGKSISVVRVEADGTQRLWKFPLAGGAPSLVLDNIKPVGYHLWVDDDTLALFVLGKPNTLQLVDLRTGKAQVIADNPGRILRRVPHENKFSFVHKTSDQEWLVKTFDLKSRNIATFIKTFPGVEDYAWTSSGVLLMASGSKLFARQKSDFAWIELADFSHAGLKNITRIAVSPKGDRIAVVAR